MVRAGVCVGHPNGAQGVRGGLGLGAPSLVLPWARAQLPGSPPASMGGTQWAGPAACSGCGGASGHQLGWGQGGMCWETWVGRLVAWLWTWSWRAARVGSAERGLSVTRVLKAVSRGALAKSLLLYGAAGAAVQAAGDS